MSAAMDARSIIRQEFGRSKNFITPENRTYQVLRRETRYHLVCECSEGDGMRRSDGTYPRLFGLSCVVYDAETGQTARLGAENGSGCFYSREERRDRKIELTEKPIDVTGLRFHAERAHVSEQVSQ